MPYPSPEFIAGLRYHLDEFVNTSRDCFTEDGASPDEVAEQWFNHLADPGFLQPGHPLAPEAHTQVLATMLALAVIELSKPPVPPITL